MRRYCAAVVACGLAILAGLPAWAQPANNGDVLIGETARGDDLSDHAIDGPLLVAIDTPYQVFDEAGTLVHVAAWAPDGTPAAGAQVYLSNHLVGATDDTGSFAFRWGVPGNDVEAYWLNGSMVQVRWQQGDEVYGGAVWFSAFSRTQSFESDHLFVYSDRGVYNPGQTIHIRSIGWHLAADFTPIGVDDAAEVELLLQAPNGTTVAGGTARADDFGVAALDLPLPARAEEGVYELVASYNGARATTRLRVETFEPPVIEIEHTIGRFLTRDIEELAFDVSLAYFTGGEFRDGTVAVDVLVEGASRYHTDREVSGPGPHAFTIDEDTLDDIRDDLVEDQRVEVQIAVSDSFGRSDDLKRELRYTGNPYIAIIEKDRDYYSSGDTVSLIVRLTDRERVPVRDTAIRIETTCDVDLDATTDDGGVAQVDFEMPDEACQVEVYLSDVSIPVATAYIPWQEPQPMRSRIEDAVVTENAPVQVTVRFPAGFEPAESVVHMDVVDTSGSLVNAVLIPVIRDGDDVYAQGSFSAPSWGSMLLTFFCLGRDQSVDDQFESASTTLGLLTEGQNLAVHPGRELTIELDGVPDELAPGASLDGGILVRDGDGQLVDAALGVSLVDRAVISLKDPLEITPMDHFYNPELRVLSTTGSAILTWPVVSRNWGASMMDIALPPFPWRAGGAIATTNFQAGAGGDTFLAEQGGQMMDPSEAEELSLDVGTMGYGLGVGVMGSETTVSQPMYMMAAPSEPSPTPEMEMAVDEPSADPGAYRRVSGEPAQPQPVVITIRTEFPETSLWAPSLRTTVDLPAQLAADLPDSITVQELTIVASDRRGGVGLLRHPIRVTQPLYVRADLPDQLTVGDRIETTIVVQNNNDAPDTVEVTLTGELVASGSASRIVEVPARGAAAVRIPIQAARAGELRYTVAARGAVVHDLEERDIHVQPAGSPDLMVFSDAVTADAAFRHSVEVPGDGQLTTAVLDVAFPAVSSAFAGLDTAQAELQAATVMDLGGEIIASALLYDYQRRAGRSPAELTPLRARIEAARFQLQAAQRPDGGWGFWWDAASSPYVTGYVLEALITLRQVDFAVDAHAMQRASEYLIGSRTEDTYDQSAISFWEGNTDAVRLGLTAELFGIQSQLPEDARGPGWSDEMQRQAARFIEYLDHDTPDVLAFSHALLGLDELSRSGVVDVERDRLVTAAQRLTTLRREGHWEPSWFNAYGGTIEATVTALRVLDRLDPERVAADVRDSVRYLLSTRDEWGGWHNPRGTAAAIRGMLLLAPTGPEVASTVRVRVDGEIVAEAAIDPADPFLSALRLRQLDLTDALPAGAHDVTIEYDGRLELHARLTLRHWGGQSDAPSGLVQLDAELSADSVQVGDVIDYQLRLASQSGNPRLVAVDVHAPANASIDRPSIQTLRDNGLVEAVQWQGADVRLFVQLDAHAERALTLRWVATRTGQAHVPPTTAQVLAGPGDDSAGLVTAAGVTLAVN